MIKIVPLVVAAVFSLCMVDQAYGQMYGGGGGRGGGASARGGYGASAGGGYGASAGGGYGAADYGSNSYSPEVMRRELKFTPSAFLPTMPILSPYVVDMKDKYYGRYSSLLFFSTPNPDHCLSVSLIVA
jgi:hypothetical protein